MPWGFRFIHCGMPGFLNNIAGRAVSILMNYLLLKQGGAIAVSVYGILMNIDFFVQSLLYGMCDSLQPAVSYNWGARNYIRVKAIEKICFIVAFIISVVCGILVFILPEQTVKLFMNNASTDLTQMAVPAVRIFSLAFLIKWLVYSIQSYLLAIEKTKEATILSVTSVAIFPIIIILALYPIGLTGFWLNTPVVSVFSVILGIYFMKKVNKKLANELEN